MASTMNFMIEMICVYPQEIKMSDAQLQPMGSSIIILFTINEHVRRNMKCLIGLEPSYLGNRFCRLCL